MPESVEVVRRVVEALNRADIDAVAESVSQDFELDFSNSRGPMSGIYRGPAGIREFTKSFFEPWASIEFQPEEVIELADGRVLGVAQIRAKGHESGVAVSARGANVWTIRDGKVAAVKLYQSKEEALEAVAS
jgi:taurine dehydrogenase small subunit